MSVSQALSSAASLPLVALPMVTLPFLLGACGGAAEGERSEVADAPAEEPASRATPAAAGRVSPGPGLGDGLAEAREVPVGGACASRLAAETFTSALCSCEDTDVAGYLRARSFRRDAESEPVGSVAVNRDYITAGFADIGGSFTVAGSRAMAFGGYLRVGQDVRMAPAFGVAGLVEVGRDAFLKADARVLGRVEIGRDLTLDAGAALRGVAIVDVGGDRRTEPVVVEPPCACAPEQIIDVAALVEAAAQSNDNARAGLAPAALERVIGIGAEVTLPPGAYYLEQLGGLGSLSLRVEGKTALFIADDLVVTGLFRVELAPGAELDVFVRDDLVIAGAASFGDAERPSATRVYVGGSGDIAVAGASAFTGNLYAPSASVIVGGFGRVDGALFAKNVIAAGFLDLGYDASILEGGQGCPPLEPGDIPTLR